MDTVTPAINDRCYWARRKMVSNIVPLQPNLFYGTGLASCVVITHRLKPDNRMNDALIIDASRGGG